MISCAAPTLVPSHIEHPEICHADIPNRLKFVFTCVDPKDEAAEFSFAVEVQDKLGATSYAGAHPSHAKLYCYAHALAKWDCAMQIAPCVHTVSLSSGLWLCWCAPMPSPLSCVSAVLSVEPALDQRQVDLELEKLNQDAREFGRFVRAVRKLFVTSVSSARP